MFILRCRAHLWKQRFNRQILLDCTIAPYSIYLLDQLNNLNASSLNENILNYRLRLIKKIRWAVIAVYTGLLQNYYWYLMSKVCWYPRMEVEPQCLHNGDRKHYFFVIDISRSLQSIKSCLLIYGCQFTCRENK